MKFTRIRLTGLATVDLPIIGALPSDRYILKSADGLGPPPRDVVISENTNGYDAYSGAKPQKRELVLRVRLNANHAVGQTAADLRLELYGMLTPSGSDVIPVEFLDGTTVVALTGGAVSTIEINPFSKDPEVQVTIPCIEAYLRAPAVKTLPLPNGRSSLSITNEGSAPTGLRAEVVFNTNRTSWTMTSVTEAGKKMQFLYAFLAGDHLIFDTTPGSKTLQLVRDGTTFNIIQGLSSDSQWFELRGGVNKWTYGSFTYDWVNLSYLPRYWGI